MKYNVKLHYHTLAIRVQKNHQNKLPWYYQLKLCYGSHFLCLMIAAKQLVYSTKVSLLETNTIK